tara:strand:- start:644 stop:907 length:264 start_codon:yes stop_codon:yes gene_type:complete
LTLFSTKTNNPPKISPLKQLFEWTNLRWIISLSGKKGQLSKKEKEVDLKKELFKNIKKHPIYKNIIDKFPDAELIDVKNKTEKLEND